MLRIEDIKNGDAEASAYEKLNAELKISTEGTCIKVDLSCFQARGYDKKIDVSYSACLVSITNPEGTTKSNALGYV